jgi:hypothetical protein
MIAALKPNLDTPPRPTDPDSWEGRYIHAFLWLRTLVGVFGSSAFEENDDDSVLEPSLASCSCGSFRTRLLDLRSTFVAKSADALVAEAEIHVTRGPIGAPEVH